MEIRSHLPFALAWEEIARKLHLDEEDGEDLRPYFEEAMRIANPKAAFCRVSVRVEGNERVWLENTCFESPLLAKNLAACQEVYPYVVTCGRELYDLCQRIEDPIMRYWLEYIAESVLRCAMLPVFEEMRALYHTTARYTMNPGSCQNGRREPKAAVCAAGRCGRGNRRFAYTFHADVTQQIRFWHFVCLKRRLQQLRPLHALELPHTARALPRGRKNFFIRDFSGR